MISKPNCLKSLVGTLGIEPRTVRLKVGCSTAELRAPLVIKVAGT